MKKSTDCIGKIRDKIRFGLMGQAMKNSLSRLGVDFNLVYLTLEGTKEMTLPVIKGDPLEYSVEALGPADLLPVCDLSSQAGREILANIGYTFNIFRNYFDQGKKCYGVKHNGEVMAFLWVDGLACRYKSIRIPLHDNEAYFSDMYTMAAYRGRNIAAYLRYHTILLLMNEGRTTLYSFTDYFNTPAKKYKKKINSVNLKLFLHLKVFRWFECTCLLRTFKRENTGNPYERTGF